MKAMRIHLELCCTQQRQFGGSSERKGLPPAPAHLGPRAKRAFDWGLGKKIGACQDTLKRGHIPVTCFHSFSPFLLSVERKEKEKREPWWS